MAKNKIGIIVSDKMAQTAVVQVARIVKHPIYQKRYQVSKKYKAHNPNNQFHTGDRVLITECAPISKDKTWQIVRQLTDEETS